MNNPYDDPEIKLEDFGPVTIAALRRAWGRGLDLAGAKDVMTLREVGLVQVGRDGIAWTLNGSRVGHALQRKKGRNQDADD